MNDELLKQFEQLSMIFARRTEYHEAVVLRDAAAAIRESQAELERLRAIVDSLPKTADGVPVVPGGTYWANHWWGVSEFTAALVEQVCADDDSGTRLQTSRLYSTEAAALAALKKA